MKYVVFLAAFISSVAYAGISPFGCTPEGFCPKTPEAAKAVQDAQQAKAKAKASQTTYQPPSAPNKPSTQPSNSKPEPAAKAK